jgi:hypothetical protein
MNTSSVVSIFKNKHNIKNNINTLLDIDKLNIHHIDLLLNNIKTLVFLNNYKVLEGYNINESVVSDIRRTLSKDIEKFLGIDIINLILSSPKFKDSTLDYSIYDKYIKNTYFYCYELILSIEQYLESNREEYYVNGIVGCCEIILENLLNIDDRLNTIMIAHFKSGRSD